jgi:hypothetical protein
VPQIAQMGGAADYVIMGIGEDLPQRRTKKHEGSMLRIQYPILYTQYGILDIINNKVYTGISYSVLYVQDSILSTVCLVLYILNYRTYYIYSILYHTAVRLIQKNHPKNKILYQIWGILLIK